MANDFLTLIKTRRSIRAYKPDAVPADVLARVLEAAVASLAAKVYVEQTLALQDERR